MAKNKITITREEFAEKFSTVAAIMTDYKTNDPETEAILVDLFANFGILAEGYLFGNKRIKEFIKEYEKITRQVN